MTRRRLIFCFVLAVASLAASQTSGEKKETALRLVMSEVKTGSMSSEHECMLVFANHSFHSERTTSSRGRDQERKIYEGNLSDADWSTLDGILENERLRKLNVPRGYVPLVMQSVHPVTISVRREKGFQNMEFMDDSSRKPYEAELKPLLQWWKSTRGRRMAASEAPADSRCTLDSSHGVFSY